jgi:hypothetical protein
MPAGPVVADPSGPDAVSRLWWALRRYLAVVVGATLVVTVMVTSVAPGPEPDEYHSVALVVAQELEGIRPEHLPRLAEAIFTGNNVAQQTIRELDLPIRPEDLVPDHARIEVLEGTVVIRVIGVSQDPRTAADVANAASEALMEELDRLGPGVGTFALQERGAVPSGPVPRPMRIPPLLIGLMGGAVLGVGVAFLLLAVRRPVIDVDDAVAVVDQPPVGVLELSQAGHYDRLEAVAGSAPLVDEIYPQRREAVVIVGAHGSATRSQVSVQLVRMLAMLGPVAVVPARDRAGRRAERYLRGVANVRVLKAPTDAPRREGRSKAPPMQEPADAPVLARPTQSTSSIPVVSDGRPSVGWVLPATARPVLVVREGTSRQQLRKAIRHIQPQRPRGVVWVANRGGPIMGALRRMREGAPPPMPRAERRSFSGPSTEWGTRSPREKREAQDPEEDLEARTSRW